MQTNYHWGQALDVHDLFIGTFDRLYARRKLDYDLHHATEI